MQSGLYEPAPNVALSVAHSLFLSPAASPCYPGAFTHALPLTFPFVEDWSSQPHTVEDSHPSNSSSLRANYIEWNGDRAELSSSENGTGGELNEEETETNENEKDWEPNKHKRNRTKYSVYQLDQLELVFSSTHYPEKKNCTTAGGSSWARRKANPQLVRKSASPAAQAAGTDRQGQLPEPRNVAIHFRASCHEHHSCELSDRQLSKRHWSGGQQVSVHCFSLVASDKTRHHASCTPIGELYLCPI